MWPAVGLWSIAATEKMHTHTRIDSFTPARPLQQQLHLDLLCECVQCSVFMDVVQMVTSHCQAQRLPSPPVPWLGSSGTSCRLLRHGGREGERAQVRYTTSTHKHLHDMSRSTKICTPVHPCTFWDILVNQVRSLWCEQMQNQNTITSKTPDIQPTDEKPAHSLQQLLLAIQFSTSWTQLLEHCLFSAFGWNRCVTGCRGWQQAAGWHTARWVPPFHGHTSTVCCERCPTLICTAPDISFRIHISLTRHLLLISESILSPPLPVLFRFLPFFSLSKVFSFRLPSSGTVLARQTHCSCRR